MKRTFRRALVLTVVITAMVICGFAFSAYAEGECHGTIESWVADYNAPTCCENGYTDYYCKFCGKLAYSTKDEAPDPKDRAKGHLYLATDYVLSDDGAYYTRVVTCQAELCKRGTASSPAVKNSVLECPTRYYRVQFINGNASPEIGEVENHAEYFLEGYYAEKSRPTWVVDVRDGVGKYIERVCEPISRVSNNNTVDPDGTVTEPGFEYFKEADGTVSLYVKEGSTAYADGKSAFAGIVPKRNNDTSHGDYELDTWVAGGEDISVKKITENTDFYAVFKPKDTLIKYTFKNDSTPIFESVLGVEYGSEVIYDGETPARASSIESDYEFAGWRVDDNNSTDIEHSIGLRAPIKLYNRNAVIFAQFRAVPKKYNIEVVDYKGDVFTYDGRELRFDNLPYFSEIISEQVSASLNTARPDTKEFAYKATGGWKISAVNGYSVAGKDILMDLNSLTLPNSVTVVNENGEEVAIGYEDYELISVSPAYYSQKATYLVTVSIMHNYFLEEDLYDNRTPRGDILDDFYVSAYDVDGNVLDSVQTNSQGKAVLNIPYSKVWRFEAVTKNNKYFGYTVVNPDHTDPDTGKYIYEIINIEGVGVAPSVTDGWADTSTPGTCNCVCHSFLSGLFIRIYNFIYRIFGIKYKCCDDLFAVHGDILIYD